MDFDQIFTLIAPEFVAVVAVCWVFGFALKRTPHIPDWSIVYIVTLGAVILTTLSKGFHVQSVIQGILCGAFAVYGNQLVKQATKSKED